MVCPNSGGPSPKSRTRLLLNFNPLSIRHEVGSLYQIYLILGNEYPRLVNDCINPSVKVLRGRQDIHMKLQSPQQQLIKDSPTSNDRCDKERNILIAFSELRSLKLTVCPAYGKLYDDQQDRILPAQSIITLIGIGSIFMKMSFYGGTMLSFMPWVMSASALRCNRFMVVTNLRPVTIRYTDQSYEAQFPHYSFPSHQENCLNEDHNACFTGEANLKPNEMGIHSRVRDTERVWYAGGCTTVINYNRRLSDLVAKNDSGFPPSLLEGRDLKVKFCRAPDLCNTVERSFRVLGLNISTT